MKPICPYPDARASIAFLDIKRCEELAAGNIDHQRAVSRHNFSKLENDMLHDRFHLTGESVIVGHSGKLLDGQHRVLAALKVRKGFWTVLVEGVDDEMFHLINTGKARSIADVLTIAGEKNAANLGSTLFRLTEYLRSAQSVGQAGNPVSTAEAFDVLQMMPNVRNSVAFCCSVTAKVASCSRLGWLHCITQDACRDLSNRFFEALASGEMLAADSPIYILRSRLIADRQSKLKMPNREVLALIIKAWNSYVEGKPLKLLRWADCEQFPILLLPRHGSRGTRNAAA